MADAVAMRRQSRRRRKRSGSAVDRRPRWRGFATYSKLSAL